MVGEQARVCEVPLQMIEVKQDGNNDEKSAGGLDQLGLDFSEIDQEDVQDFCNGAVNANHGKPANRFAPEHILAEQPAMASKEKLDFFGMQ